MDKMTLFERVNGKLSLQTYNFEVEVPQKYNLSHIKQKLVKSAMSKFVFHTNI